MTNPNDSVGTNGAYGGRTSVNALNDVLASFTGRGVLSGWAVTVSSGMTVSVGGSAGVRDVAIAEDNAGNRTTVDNRSSSPISVTLSAASSSSTRVDYIVAYVNNPATVLVTTIDNPGTCGIIAVNGTTSAPTESAVRSAITADGGTGSTAYYVVLATITIAAGTTDLTDSAIAQGEQASTRIPAVAKGAVLQRFNSTYNTTTTYTAGYSGFLCGKAFVNTNENKAEVRINGIRVAGLPFVNTGTGSTVGSIMIQIRFCVPVAAGDTILLEAPKGGFEELQINGARWV